ncbi:hypothetical protein NAEGRDRAFT_78472 [Naegleria gruberi]|uniref:Proteasome assembly chaperone 2 n=1 Tax=Naegleria gruberi TaxID=5762 RepID=D2V415_NAEGR|nr:uncharacterized protein NAEGRDRAFT_78472 [Naegleria gruberi]EFC48298.1 hypothetical protein NAEGRDRAFT_78472 [Naegleria gruberi]|eukprot:XP_002681042.1 hypothetical protein NAEGRDRAFT_78472 [Naegleria gruberi strain NEG-M]
MKFFPFHSSSTGDVSSDVEIKQLLQQAEFCMISVPSIGNVGQLAMDFMISTFYNSKCAHISKLGYLETGFLLHCVGNDPYVHHRDNHVGEVHSALEVYSLQFHTPGKPEEKVGSNIVLIHCRSIIIYPTLFVRDLNEWLAQGNDDYFLKSLQNLIILSSANAGLQDDSFIQFLQEKPLEFGLATLSCDVNVVDETTFPHDQYLSNIPKLDRQKYPLFVSGVNAKLMENQETFGKNGESNGQVRKLNRAIVFMICNEGENSIHGTALCRVVTGEIILPFIKNNNKGTLPFETLDSIEWKIPHSWRHFYGNPISDLNLYN